MVVAKRIRTCTRHRLITHFLRSDYSERPWTWVRVTKVGFFDPLRRLSSKYWRGYTIVNGAVPLAHRIFTSFWAAVIARDYAD